MNPSAECTCPPPPPDTGPGVAVRRPGTSHRRGCPVVQWLFDSQDRIAREVADRFERGGIIQTPGERAEAEVRELRRRVDELEARERSRA